MEEVIKLNSVDQYNKMYGLETLHPLVTVVDLSKATVFPTHFTLNYGLYALFLKQTKCGDLRYGRQMYDYQEGTVTSFAPGQVVEVKLNDGVRPMSHGILSIPTLSAARLWDRKSSTTRSFHTHRMKPCIFRTTRKRFFRIALTRYNRSCPVR